MFDLSNWIARASRVVLPRDVFEVFDAVGLAAFTVIGVAIASSAGAEPLLLWGPLCASAHRRRRRHPARRHPRRRAQPGAQDRALRRDRAGVGLPDVVVPPVPGPERRPRPASASRSSPPWSACSPRAPLVIAAKDEQPALLARSEGDADDREVVVEARRAALGACAQVEADPRSPSGMRAMRARRKASNSSSEPDRAVRPAGSRSSRRREPGQPRARVGTAALLVLRIARLRHRAQLRDRVAPRRVERRSSHRRSELSRQRWRMASRWRMPQRARRHAWYTPYQSVKYMSSCCSIGNACVERGRSPPPDRGESAPASEPERMTLIADTESSAAPTPWPQTSSR